jgi:hypothetical protein
MKNRREPSESEIHVLRGAGETWLVKHGEAPVAFASYRLRSHAMAFARAVAFSSNADMIVHDLCGLRTRHARASLSYPTSLD